jgi:crotonobetainyl-CoA:carnitine CoA-transferase CaiB-like acyl-CoA transferase
MLGGLKVVELATYIAAPAAAGILADWGAQVIKVEAPGGDPYRRGYETLSPSGVNPIFELDNRGKQSVVLDIVTAAGKAALLRLIGAADVFLTNLRPGALKRAGIDFETLKDDHPGLIYASVTGYGLEGPDADLPGFDVAAFWARAGVAALMTPKGVEPFPVRTGLGDHTCALATALGILAAAFSRTQTGKGRLVESSLLRSGVYALSGDMAILLRLGRVASTRQRKASRVPLVNFFRTREGRWVCLMPRNSRTDWPKIAAAADRPDLIEDERFRTDAARQANVEAVVEALDEGFSGLAFDEVARRLTAADVVWSPVQSAREVAADPQAHAAGCFVQAVDGSGAGFTAPATPIRFSDFDSGPKGRAPNLGEHTRGVLIGAGLSMAEVDAMIAASPAPMPLNGD